MDEKSSSQAEHRQGKSFDKIALYALSVGPDSFRGPGTLVLQQQENAPYHGCYEEADKGKYAPAPRALSFTSRSTGVGKYNGKKKKKIQASVSIDS
jgi:hypothetical protein